MLEIIWVIRRNPGKRLNPAMNTNPQNSSPLKTPFPTLTPHHHPISRRRRRRKINDYLSSPTPYPPPPPPPPLFFYSIISTLSSLLPPLPTTTSSALLIFSLSLFTVPFVPLPFSFSFSIPLTLSLSKLSPNFIFFTIISSLLSLSSVSSSTPPPTPPPSTVSPMEPTGSPVGPKWWSFTMQWFWTLLSLRHLCLQLICSIILKKDKLMLLLVVPIPMNLHLV
ncbi:hypothetical protein Lalb_Chr03g0035391 [Lupinus albus]|uniref:Uncharacterized protein n=1 Tax=Lupinus albus TaxID=3870 RepID=A0A6A4QSU9_LUPAL|nr:hypothetical protein Lalb_Chr03g0035391 [Lupinus albus]